MSHFCYSQSGLLNLAQTNLKTKIIFQDGILLQHQMWNMCSHSHIWSCITNYYVSTDVICCVDYHNRSISWCYVVLCFLWCGSTLFMMICDWCHIGLWCSSDVMLLIWNAVVSRWLFDIHNNVIMLSSWTFMMLWRYCDSHYGIPQLACKSLIFMLWWCYVLKMACSK